MSEENMQVLPFAVPVDAPRIIKIIGVGGGGSNAVQNMYKEGVHNVSFAICNTDSQALAQADIPIKIQLGSAGLGVGGKPEKGREAAESSIDAIQTLFEDDTEMVFITCGMGGGTGTGAAPVIAGLAKEKGILTVGVVTIPFAFEGKVKIKKALQGVEEMRKKVDSLLVINNERLCEIYSNEILRLEDGLAKADEVVTIAAKSISEIITMRGIINRDFCDVQTVMKDGGDAIMSVGYASGENRIGKAFIEALKSPLLNKLKDKMNRKISETDLVQKTKHWLGGYPDALKQYDSALAKYEGGIFERNTLDDMRLSFELLVKALLNNGRSLENQIADLGAQLKIANASSELRNMVTQIIKYYTDFQNNHVKHNDAVNENEIEYVIELTSVVMKYLIKVLG